MNIAKRIYFNQHPKAKHSSVKIECATDVELRAMAKRKSYTAHYLSLIDAELHKRGLFVDVHI